VSGGAPVFLADVTAKMFTVDTGSFLAIVVTGAIAGTVAAVAASAVCSCRWWCSNWCSAS
jgi:hypothetical protein